MSYSLVIEGEERARKVRRGLLPRRGDWLSVELGGRLYWFRVHEVCYALTEEERLKEAEEGCDLVHERAEPIVFTSLATSTEVVPSTARREEENFKQILPPTRWPFGGRSLTS